MDRWKVWLALALRVSTLVGRFGLVMALAAISNSALVGAFGLYSSALILAYSLMGMDVYATTSRQLLSPEPGNIPPLQAHAGYLAVSFLVLAPVAILCAGLSGAVDGVALFLVFALHLGVEYFCQEFGRLLIVIGFPLGSTVILFLRSALWVPLVVIAVWLKPGEDSLLLVVGAWLAGSTVAAIAAWWMIHSRARRSLRPLFDPAWIKSAIRSSLVFFTATLLFRALMNGDKFVVASILPIGAVGVYTVYASVAMGLSALAEAGISAWLYPPLVSAIQSREWRSVADQLRHFRSQMAIGAVAGALSMALALPVAFRLAGKPEYLRDIDAYYLVLAGTAAYCASMPYHYVIYGFKADRWFLYVYLGAFACMLLIGALAIPAYGVTGAGLMLCGALAFIAAGRVFAARRLMRNAFPAGRA